MRIDIGREAMKYTIEQLQAMHDAELGELTARLRGWTLSHGQWFEGQRCEVYNDHEGAVMSCDSWNPAADIAQAYGLLEWMTQSQYKCSYQIWGGKTMGNVKIQAAREDGGDDVIIFVSTGKGAREVVYAFVLAMQEMQEVGSGDN